MSTDTDLAALDALTIGDPETFMADFMKMREEPLDPDLEKYVTVSKRMGWKMFHHPLFIEAPFTTPGRVNRGVRAKQAVLEEAEADEDWTTCIFLHERPYRTDALIDYVVGRTEFGEVISLAGATQEVIDLAADVWVDSENIGQHIEDWTALFDAPGFFLASEEERAEFEQLPETFTVYRGVCDDGDWSWTLSFEVADRFAKMVGNSGVVLEGTVAKADVFGYLTRRNESEVLVRPGTVKEVS